MIELAAPYPAIQTVTQLPSPQWGDNERVMDQVIKKRAMDGTRYTYVKRKGDRRKLQWTFRLTRNKGLELRAFIESYFATKLHVTDHQGNQWVGHLTSNPFEFETTEAANPPIAPLPRGEIQTIVLEFEGSPQT